MIKLFLLFFYCTTTFASEKSILRGELSRFYTTDDLEITKKEFSFQNNRRDLFWNYPGAEEVAYDLGVSYAEFSGSYQVNNFISKRTSLLLGKKWGFDDYTFIKVGGHELTYQNQKSSVLSYQIGHQTKTENTIATVLLEKDFQFIQQQIPAPLDSGLIRDALQLNWQYTLESKEWRFPVQLRKTVISDDNEAIDYEVSAYYGRSYPVWWWIGYGVSGLNYDNRVPGYWSPEKFISHGPRFELTHQLAEYWQVSVGYNYNFIKEDDFASGISTYSTIGLIYGERDVGLIKLSWIDINSEQASSEWKSRGYLLTFEKSF